MKPAKAVRLMALFLAVSVPVNGTDRVSDASSGRYPTPGDLVLFPMDDDFLPWRDNLKLTLDAPKRYSGNPVLRPGPSGSVDEWGAILYGTVIKQGSKFRMWYLASPRVDSRIPGDEAAMQSYRPVAYAESTDGINWERPNLGMVTFRGNRNNNLVSIVPDTERYARPHDFISVLYDPDDPDANRRYKMAYIVSLGNRQGASTATAVSPDGLHWKLINTTNITRGHFENTSLIKFQGLYYASGQNFYPFNGHLPDGTPAGRVMTAFYSPDFQHWSPGRALNFYRSGHEPKPERYGQEMHMGAGLWNRGNVIVGLYGRWYGDTITEKPPSLAGLKMDLGLLVSNDAVHYREPVRDFIAVRRGDASAWDAEAILEANAFANTETETYIWYSNWNTSRPYPLPPLPEAIPAKYMHTRASVGLLRMPRDRFGYFSKVFTTEPQRVSLNVTMRGENWEASCTTKPIRLPKPADLYANVDGASASAPLKIELVDDADRALPGYGAQIAASSLKERVQWAGKKPVPANAAFRIKISWPVGAANPKLYALYLEQR